MSTTPIQTPRTDAEGKRVILKYPGVRDPSRFDAMCDFASILEVELVLAQRTLSDQAGRIGELERALGDLLFVHENADETGYVDGVGFVKGFDELPEKCRSALQPPPAKPEAKTLQGEAR